jgi:hypothetical protein
VDLVQALAQVQLRKVALKHMLIKAQLSSQVDVWIRHHVLVSQDVRLWEWQLGDNVTVWNPH